jgi:beta-1,4-mannosyl-glycoprotein beta-1,4-N-acetylglucosaminyltransferase
VIKPRIYDCFCFFNEEEILRMRLETLWDVVDVFVVVESVKTFSGNPKPLYFQPSAFEKYLSKIRHVIVDDYPCETSKPWLLEEYQRNAISRGLTGARDHDWVMIGDVDEIPNPSRITAFDPDRFLRGDFIQDDFAYYLNNRRLDKAGHGMAWPGTKITTYRSFWEFFGCAERTRSYKSSGVFRKIKKWWFCHFRTQSIRNGGWHFSWMNGPDKIIEKLESYSHQEHNIPGIKNSRLIHQKIHEGSDILGEDYSYKAIPLDNTFPAPLLNNPSSYSQMILSDKI